MKKFYYLLLAVVGFPSLLCAEPPAYTPLLTSTSLDGVKADVGTAAAGIIAVMLIVLGVGLLVRVFR